MPTTWVEITNDERWDDLSYDQKVALRDSFFEDQASRVARDEDHKEAIRKEFYARAVIDQPILDKIKKKLPEVGFGIGVDRDEVDAVTGPQQPQPSHDQEAPTGTMTYSRGADNYEIPVLPGKTQQESFDAFISDPANAATGTEGGVDQPWQSGDVQFDQKGNVISGLTVNGAAPSTSQTKKEKDEESPYSPYKQEVDFAGRPVEEPETTEQALDESYYGRPGSNILDSANRELPDPVEHDPISAGINEEFGAWQAKNQGEDFLAWLTARAAPAQEFAGGIMSAAEETLGFIGDRLKKGNPIDVILKSELGDELKRDNPELYEKLTNIKKGQEGLVDGVFENPELAKAAGWLTDKAEVNRRIGSLGRPDGEVLGALYDATGAVPDMIFEIAGGLYGGQKAALTVMATRMYITEYERSTRIDDLPAKDAHLNALVSAASEVLPEIPVFDRLFRKLGPAAKGGAKKLLKETLLIAVMEGGSESITQVIQLMDRIGRRGEEITFDEAMKEIRTAAMTGAFMGPIMKGVTTHPSQWNERKWADKQFTDWMTARANQFAKADFSEQAEEFAVDALDPLADPGMNLNLKTGRPLDPPVHTTIAEEEDVPPPEPQAPQPVDIDMSGMEQNDVPQPEYEDLDLEEDEESSGFDEAMDAAWAEDEAAERRQAEEGSDPLDLDQEPEFYEDEQGNRYPSFEAMSEAGYGDLPLSITRFDSNEERIAAIDKMIPEFEERMAATQEAISRAGLSEKKKAEYQGDIDFYMSTLDAMRRYKEEFGADAAPPTEEAATNQESQDEEQQVSPESEGSGGRPLREQEGGPGSEQGQADTEPQPEEGQQSPRIYRPYEQSSEGDQVEGEDTAEGGEFTPDAVEPISVEQAEAALEEAEAEYQAAWDSDPDTRPPGLVARTKKARDKAQADYDAAVKADRENKAKEEGAALESAVTRLAELVNMDNASLAKEWKKVKNKPKGMGREGKVRVILQSEGHDYFDAVEELKLRAEQDERDKRKGSDKPKKERVPLWKRKSSAEVQAEKDAQAKIDEWEAVKAGDSYDYGEDPTNEIMDEVEADLVEVGWKRVEASTVQGKQHGTYFVNTKNKLTAFVVNQSGSTKVNIVDATEGQLKAAGVKIESKKETAKKAPESPIGPEADLSEVFAEELALLNEILQMPEVLAHNNDLIATYKILSKSKNQHTDEFGDKVLYTDMMESILDDITSVWKKIPMSGAENIALRGKLLDLSDGILRKTHKPSANEIRKRKAKAAEKAAPKPKTKNTENKPKAKSVEGFPTPNEHGVYDKSDIHMGDHMSFESKAKANKVKADVWVLETENGWIVATDYSTEQGGRTTPLMQSHGTYETKNKAMIAGLERLKKDATINNEPMSYHKAIEQVATQIEKSLEAFTSGRADDFVSRNTPSEEGKKRLAENEKKAAEKKAAPKKAETEKPEIDMEAIDNHAYEILDARLRQGDKASEAAPRLAKYLANEYKIDIETATESVNKARAKYASKSDMKPELRPVKTRHMDGGYATWTFGLYMEGELTTGVRVVSRPGSGSFQVRLTDQKLIHPAAVFTTKEDAFAFLDEMVDHIVEVKTDKPANKYKSYTYEVVFAKEFIDRWSNPVVEAYDFVPLKYTPTQMGFSKSAAEWFRVDGSTVSTNGKILDWGNKEWYDKNIKGYSKVRNVPESSVNSLKEGHQKDKPAEIQVIGVYSANPGPNAEKQVIFENGKEAVAANRMFVDHFVSLYGKDIVFKQGKNPLNAIGVYKDGELVGLFMPIKLTKDLGSKSIQWWKDQLGKAPAAKTKTKTAAKPKKKAPAKAKTEETAEQKRERLYLKPARGNEQLSLIVRAMMGMENTFKLLKALPLTKKILNDLETGKTGAAISRLEEAKQMALQAGNEQMAKKYIQPYIDQLKKENKDKQDQAKLSVAEINDSIARTNDRANEIWEGWIDDAIKELEKLGVDTTDIDRAEVSENLYLDFEDATNQAIEEEATEAAKERTAKTERTINLGFFGKADSTPMQMGSITEDSLRLEAGLGKLMPNLEKGTFRQVPAPKKYAKRVAEVEKAFGKEIIFVRIRGKVPFGMNGAVITEDAGRIFVNVESQNPIMAVIGHELLHTVRVEYPGLYQDLAIAASKRITSKEYDKYARQYRAVQGFENMTTDALFEELVANLVGDAFMDDAFVDGLVQEDASWFRKLLNRMIEILERMKGKTAQKTAKYPLKTDVMFKDIESLQNEIKAILNSFDAKTKAKAKPKDKKVALHRANHGSGSLFRKFDISQIGTGEGNQAFGWGLYFAESPGVAKSYVITEAKQLTPDEEIYTKAQMFVNMLNKLEGFEAWVSLSKTVPAQDVKLRKALFSLLQDKKDIGFGRTFGQKWKKHIDSVNSWEDVPTIAEIDARPPFESHWDISEGGFYEVEIADHAIASMMAWNETMQNQPDGVADKLYSALNDSGIFESWEDLLTEFEDMKGINLYHQLSYRLGGPKQASLYLESYGIAGIKYKDAMSRHMEGGTNNYVLFSDENVTIITRNGENIEDTKPAWLDTAGGSVKFQRQHDQETKEALSKAGVPIDKTLKERLHDVMHIDWGTAKVETQDWSALGAVDKFHGIKRAYREYLGVDLGEGYIDARLSTGSASTMRGILLYGAPEYRDGVISRISGTKGLLDIFADVRHEMGDFMGWMAARRAHRLINTTDAKGNPLETNFTRRDIQKLKELSAGDIEVDGATVSRLEVYERVAEEFNTFRGQVLDMMEQAGLIDPLKRAVWDKADWIPFYRMRYADDKGVTLSKGLGLSHQTSAIRRLTGRPEPIEDPFSSIIMNFTHAVESSMKNTALKRTVDDLIRTPALTKIPNFKFKPALIPNSEIKRRLKDDGISDQTIAELEAEAADSDLDLFQGISEMWQLAQPVKGNVVRIMRDGKAEYYEVHDKMLLASIVNIDMRSMKWMAIFRIPKSILTGAVTADPAFMLRNFTRDALQAYVINRDGMIPVVDSVKGMVKAAMETHGMLDMMFAGGSFQGGYVNGTDAKAARKSVRGALRAKGYDNKYIEKHLDSIIDFTAKGWDKWRRIGDAVENANREAVYEAAMKAGKTRKMAIYEAKDLMDFSMQGQWAVARALSDMLPFFNARMQGIYKLGRSGAIPVPGLIAKEVAIKGMYLMFLSLALAWYNKDNDDYEALDEWDKDMYWHFFVGTPFHFRWPKPFEIGVLYGTVPERTLRLVTGADELDKFQERMGFAFKETLAFDPIHPQLTKPWQEIDNNKVQFTKRPIHTAHELRGKLPRSRYNVYTSDTMVAMGTFLEGLGLSPKEGEHLIRGYFGTLGNYSLMAADVITRWAIGAPPVPAKSASELPVVSAFYRGDTPRWSTRYGTEMYEMHEEITQLFGTVKGYYDSDKEADAEALLAEGSNDELLDLTRNKQWKWQSRTKLEMDEWARERSELRKEIEAIYADPLMLPETKRKERDRLVRERNELDKEAFKYFSPLFERK